MELTGPGLLLRGWRDADAPAALDAFGDPAIALWNPQGEGLDLAAARRWVRRRADWSAGDHVCLAIADPDDPAALLGSVSLHRIHQGDASIGYWTVPAARGRGLASAAVSRLTAWAFADLGIERIELCHAVANVASCRVAQRAGYPAEGTLRQSHRYGDGRRHDEHLHARLATD
ncbi:GNAT family N-acetyltransferase [Micromonospora radicis]|uniref:GNAT family N-acetyltransferase n=1 Tax=Micromonospora radicis TaxID=1894971 RepID=UPI001F27B774|nr:GNAT family protein [Micromonospora radicis]